MKNLFLLITALLLTFAVYSQNVQYEDVVYLKNGSIIRGMIVEQIPNQTLKIKTVDKSPTSGKTVKSAFGATLANFSHEQKKNCPKT